MQRQRRRPMASGADDPAAAGAERAVGAAAEQLEGLVERRHGLALVIHQAAPRQISRPPSVTMKDGHAEIADQPALEAADQRADDEADQDRRRSRCSSAEADELGQAARPGSRP